MNAARVGSLALMAFSLTCGVGTEDPATEPVGGQTDAPTVNNGQLSCPPGKDLICHFPPGNPGNAHTICVAPSAWPPHHRLHDDTFGRCGSMTGGPPDGGTVGADAGPACSGPGATCLGNALCCAGLACLGGVCTVVAG